MATETKNTVFDDVLQNVRKAAETNLKMQQEFFQQWSSLWPGMPKPQSEWIDQVREFQTKWADTVSELAHKHREVLDKQYETAVASLDEALQLPASKDPAEFRERSEQFYRKTLDCLREISEVQMGEFKEAVSKWSEFVTKASTAEKSGK